ncbi:transglutaminase-like cysteine peptidase [Undibacterium sp. Ji22W]|uniref:transglutaminase-like cysteine peptidase n=1 Tax=Undibacterium sp. Ji22W TaxID=3413038 RepID=UPI003BF02843
MTAAISLNSFGINWDRLRLSMRALGGEEQIFNEWSALIMNNSEMPIEVKLQKVNLFFNRKIIYTDDIEAWGQSDYWATPLESLAKKKGDCEDFVIAKYFSLRNLNIPDAQLRLVYVKARIGGVNSNITQAHMVLAFYPTADAEPLILDNLISDIRPASRRNDLAPIFSFNGQGIFAGAASNATLGPGGTSRLSRWQDLLERARKEGFE